MVSEDMKELLRDLEMLNQKKEVYETVLDSMWNHASTIPSPGRMIARDTESTKYL